jgi:hypothetical protein
MGPRSFLPEDIDQLQKALAAYSLASRQEDGEVIMGRRSPLTLKRRP